MGHRTPGRETSQESIPFSNTFLRKCHFLHPDIFFLMVLMCSWVSWPKNDAERSRNYFKKSVLDPKHVKFDKTLHSDMSGRSAGSWGTVEVWISNIFYGMFRFVFVQQSVRKLIKLFCVGSELPQKTCRIKYKFNQKVSFGSEMWKSEENMGKTYNFKYIFTKT